MGTGESVGCRGNGEDCYPIAGHAKRQMGSGLETADSKLTKINWHRRDINSLNVLIVICMSPASKYTCKSAPSINIFYRVW